MMSGVSVFLTGAPGAGKTYVLNQFITLARAQGKNVAVTASTGIAATHIGGTTIHSWSGLGIKDALTQWDLEKLSASAKYVKRYNATDVLVIDEVSMLHGARLDMVNLVAKTLRQNPAPFGGMQVILVGDLFQLPPISRGREEVDFVHLSSSWQELAPTVCYLTEQHRVSAGDTLLDLLVAMRRGDVNELHEIALQERLAAAIPSDGTITKLYTHNADVDTINQTHLAALGGDIHRYAMQSSGPAAKREQLIKSVLAPEILELKRGAEVMFVANNFAEGYVNGTRGTVIDFVGETPVVVTASGREIKVERTTWSMEEDGRAVAEVAQLPLRLAWAITIHKSQGMSLDAAEIDLSRSFTPGMGYVALSRVRTMDGIYLRGINRMALAMHPYIFDFDSTIRLSCEAHAETIADYMPEAANSDTQTENTELFEALRRWRNDRATTDHVPAYIVLHDATLHELASRRPITEQALKGIKGLGPMKLAKYQAELLELLKK